MGLRWFVRRRQRQIQKERRLALGRFGDEVYRFVGESIEHAGDHKVFRARALADEVWKGDRRLLLRRRHREAVIANVDVRRHVERCADAEVRVEAVMYRAVADHAGKVDARIAIPTLPVDIILQRRKLHPQVPLADGARLIAALLEHRGDRRSLPLQQRRAIAAQHAALQRAAPAVAARQQPIPRRCANGGRRMAVGKSHSFRRQLIQVGRWDFRFRIQCAHVAVTHVIRQDDHDVRLICRVRGKDSQGKCKTDDGGNEKPPPGMPGMR